MCTHLAKRGSTYYFRRVIPEHLRSWFDGRTQWMYTLSTKDRDQAKRRVARETVKTDETIAMLERRVAAGERPAGSVEVDGAYYMARTEDDLARQAAVDRAEDEREERRREREPYRAEIEAKFKRSTTAQLTRSEAAMRDMLRDQAYEAAIANDRAMAARAELAELRAVGSPAPVPALPSPVMEPDSIMLDTDVVDRWSKERRVSAKGIDTHRRVAEWFYTRVGRKPVADITKKDVLAFKDKLIDEGQSLANTGMKLSRLRTMLQWAYDNDLAPLNAADGVKVKDTQAGRYKRLPFDLAALNRIMAGPVYAYNLRPVQGRGEAAYWLPLLALFTGARVEELGQLRPSDVTQITYPDDNGDERQGWFLRITEDEDEGLRIKNASSERRVPLHPELERLGFIAFVEAMRKAHHARLFYLLRPDKYGRYTAKWGEWWSGYMRGDCGITDRRMVFHSFRHTFKHHAGHVGMIEGVQRQIMGHTPGDVADDYRGGYSLFQLVQGMSLYRLAGLKLPKQMLGAFSS
ncbi:MAG: DUF6538 domain-containing protein [Pseudomonadota bacterium]